MPDDFDADFALGLARAQRKTRHRRSALDQYGSRIEALLSRGASLRDVSEWLSITDPTAPNAPSTILRFLQKRGVDRAALAAAPAAPAAPRSTTRRRSIAARLTTIKAKRGT